MTEHADDQTAAFERLSHADLQRVGLVVDMIAQERLETAEKGFAPLGAPALRKLGELLDRASQLAFDLARKKVGDDPAPEALAAEIALIREALAPPSKIAPVQHVSVDFDLDGDL